MPSPSSGPSTLKLALPTQNAPTEILPPNLMPFHISYSGKAPISTYLRVKDAPSAVGMPSVTETAGTTEGVALNNPLEAKDATKDATNASGPAAGEGSASTVLMRSDSVATILGAQDDAEMTIPVENTVSTIDAPTISTTSSSTTIAASSSSSSTTTVAPKDSVADVSASLATLEIPSTGQGKRTVSAFRGRKIYGLDVELPEGYTGVVLRKPAAAAPAPSTNSRTRSSQRNKRVEAMEVDEEEEEGGNIRELQVSSRFSAFTLWHPDIPVVERDDVYLRSIREWTALAAVIHETGAD